MQASSKQQLRVFIKHWDKQCFSKGLSLFVPYLSAKVKEPSFSAGTFISMFTFLNSSVLCCPEGNERFFLISGAQHPSGISWGAHGQHMDHFWLWLYKYSPVPLIACIPEQPLDKGSESFHTSNVCQLKAVSAQTLCLEAPVRAWTPRSFGGKGSQYHRHSGLTTGVVRKKAIFPFLFFLPFSWKMRKFLLNSLYSPLLRGNKFLWFHIKPRELYYKHINKLFALCASFLYHRSEQKQTWVCF